MCNDYRFFNLVIMPDTPIQVSGHAGSLSMHAGGAWILKQCSAVEAHFYQSVWQEDTEGADALRPLMPVCYGIADDRGQWLPGWSCPLQLEPSSMYHVLLENLTAGFERPCVSDWKIGTQLYDERDPYLTEEKRTRMQRKAAETTSGSFGLRVTGWQTWNKAQQTYIRANKAPGRAANTVADLDSLWQHVLDGGDERCNALRRRISRYTLQQLEHIQQVMSSLEVRVRGASVLVIYEGDDETAAAKLSGSGGPPVSLRLIDYAHARWCHGEGPDPGAALGLTTLIGVVRRACD